jgi:hypothetical protein
MAVSGMWRVSEHALERRVVDRGHGVLLRRNLPSSLWDERKFLNRVLFKSSIQRDIINYLLAENRVLRE